MKFRTPTPCPAYTRQSKAKSVTINQRLPDPATDGGWRRSLCYKDF
ncbi:hypothetical protein [Coleofasciculus sp. FACHB-1120]|nr:hypothetical protein [Coleofasciculus sp. FACHB-1120]MBD2740477.1 hypothetical protein [Coleofasciculus sp. FACHB-1120]